MGVCITSGHGESRILAEDIYNILKQTYTIQDLNLVLPKESCDYSKKEKDSKQHRNLCIETFPDSEIRIEIGKEELKKMRDHVIFVKYLYEPGVDVSINDCIIEAAAFGDLIRNKKIKKLTYILPYLPYVRAHSIDKYIKKGLYQTDTLKLFIKIMELAGVSEIITIDPHSEKVWDYCNECNIKGIGLDPFNSQTYGAFQKYYEMNKEDYKNLIIVVPDKGSYTRSKEFAHNIRKKDSEIALIEKKRTDMGEVEITGFKEESEFKEKNIKGKSFLIIDDMISSGETVNLIVKYLKSKGAKKVATWISHAVAPKQKKIEGLQIDKIVALDTIRQNIKNFEIIKATGNLMAHAIYKSLK